MAKKDKKKKDEAPVVQEVLLGVTDLESEPEEVQYTDTSYTSASFESLPPPPVVDEGKKKKKSIKKKVEEEATKRGSSQMFQWSEESLPQEEVKPEEEPKEKKKKEKTKKKGKKDKDKEEIPDFEKPKAWKKMAKKDRDAWLKQRIDDWRIDQEAEKQAKLAGAKEKKATLARERAELLVKDNLEQDIRRDLLDKTCILFARYENQKHDYENKKQIKAEWSQYLRCDGLPDPRVVTQMSTYLHLWKERAVYDDNELDQKCTEALPMLEMLEEFVANSRQYTPEQAANYNEIRLALRQQLAVAIEFASYSLLRDLEKHLKSVSIKLATYNRVFKALKLNLWVAVRMPTRRPKPVEPDLEPVELEFPAIKVSVKLPTNIDGTDVCVRASLTLIDLLSESSRSFALAAEMPNRYEDLFIFNVKEHVETYKLKKDQDVIRNNFYKTQRDRIKELEALIKSNVYAQLDKEKEELDALNLSEPPALPDPRAFVAETNEKAFKKYLKTCNTRTRSGEINLRKYRICGGVLNLDLLLTPPQPKHMKYEVTITTSLEDTDFGRRIEFCRHLKFEKEAIVNYHNLHHWASINQNPHVKRARKFQRRFSVNVWAGVIGNRLIGPHYLPDNINGANYLEFLENDLPDLVEEVFQEDRPIVFQHDGCPAHWSLIVREHLSNIFPNSWIGRGGPIPWPPRSPDLTPIDFYVWGRAKELVYTTEVARINAAFEVMKAEMLLGTTTVEIRKRCRACIANQGQQFEQLL